MQNNIVVSRAFLDRTFDPGEIELRLSWDPKVTVVGPLDEVRVDLVLLGGHQIDSWTLPVGAEER
jgi:hypothetical protein